ncbi:hypothetical protein FS837_001779 [Tulasnella sp. UAMH 9824]|nr:hypothetical protein FS837_001779 [Tulasnella sp. UAMH 9824]
MFAKLRSTRIPAAATPAPAPQFEAGPPSQSASKASPSLVKKLFRVKHVFRRSSSTQRDAHHQDTSSRQQDVQTSSRPFQGPSDLTHDPRAEPDRRPYLHLSVEPTQSSPFLNLSPPFQAGWRSSTSPAPRRSNLSATASPLLASPQPAAATPARSIALTRPSSNRPTQSTAPRLTTSLHTSSLLAPPAFLDTTPVTSPALAPSSFQSSARSTTSARHQGVQIPSRPSQGLSALIHDVRAEPARRPNLHPSVEPTQSSRLLDLSPPFQAGWQGSLATSSAAHRSNLSATASPLLASTQSAAATPAASFAPTLLSSNRSNQPAAPCSTTSPHTSSRLAPPAFIATTPTTSPAPARSPFQSSARSAASRPTYSPKISSPLASPRSVATTFSSAHYPSQHSAPFTAPHSTSSLNTSPLLAPPQSVATTPATKPSALFSSFDCSKPGNISSPTHQLTAELEETVAHLHRQYEDARRSAHTMIQWHVFPYAKSLDDEAKKAKEELDEVLKQIAAVDSDCSKLEALLRDGQEKFEEAGEALKKEHWHREGIEEEHALLLDENHELQAGQPVNGVWQQRPSEPLQQNSTPSQSVASKERGSSLATLESPQRVKSWDSQWESMVERQRYSLPRPVQATTSESNEPERRTNNARPANTSDYFGTPLRWGQLASASSVHQQKENARRDKCA